MSRPARQRVYHEVLMLQTLFHAWERRLASATTDRVVRPFEWGLDWIPHVRRSPQAEGRSNGSAPDARPEDVLRTWGGGVMADTDAFFTPPPTSDYTMT